VAKKVASPVTSPTSFDLFSPSPVPGNGTNTNDPWGSPSPPIGAQPAARVSTPSSVTSSTDFDPWSASSGPLSNSSRLPTTPAAASSAMASSSMGSPPLDFTAFESFAAQPPTPSRSSHFGSPHPPPSIVSPAASASMMSSPVGGGRGEFDPFAASSSVGHANYNGMGLNATDLQRQTQQQQQQQASPFFASPSVAPVHTRATSIAPLSNTIPDFIVASVTPPAAVMAHSLPTTSQWSPSSSPSSGVSSTPSQSIDPFAGLNAAPSARIIGNSQFDFVGTGGGAASGAHLRNNSNSSIRSPPITPHSNQSVSSTSSSGIGRSINIDPFGSLGMASGNNRAAPPASAPSGAHGYGGGMNGVSHQRNVSSSSPYQSPFPSSMGTPSHHQQMGSGGQYGIPSMGNMNGMGSPSSIGVNHQYGGMNQSPLGNGMTGFGVMGSGGNVNSNNAFASPPMTPHQIQMSFASSPSYVGSPNYTPTNHTNTMNMNGMGMGMSMGNGNGGMMGSPSGGISTFPSSTMPGGSYDPFGSLSAPGVARQPASMGNHRW
jgi:hypothetical protein